jgi:hypothetical protein
MEVDPIELLGRLEDDLRRAQELTGVASREREAEQRLAELGYDLDEGLAAALEEFRVEAGLPSGGGLDREAWDELEQLRGLDDDEIDPDRWRGEDGEWLPAMRRAIVTRVVELTLSKVPERERDVPSVERVSRMLRAVDFLRPDESGLEGMALEDALVPLLLRRRLDDGEPERPIERLRRTASERRATRRQRRDAEREVLWPEIERIVRSREFVGEFSRVDVVRVLRAGFAEAFEAAHLAMARFVEHVEARNQGAIRLNRRSRDVCVVVDRGVSRAEIMQFVEGLRRQDRSLLICAELLGTLLGITVAWRPGMGPAGVLRSMVGSVPRIIALGRELADVWTPQSTGGSGGSGYSAGQ